MSSGVTSTFSLDGLVSGLNTTQIVNQLIGIESRTRLLTQQRMNGFQAQGNALSLVGGKLATLKTSALSVSSAADWEPLSASTSDADTVAVAASSASGTGSISFTVDSLATPDAYASGWTVSATTSEVVADPGGGAPRTINIGTTGDVRSLDVGNGTLEEVVSAINGQSNFHVTASAIKVGDNAYRLQLSSSQAGASNAVVFTAGEFAPAGSWLHVSTAADSRITVGSGAASFTVTGSSNTLSDVLPGVTMTLKRTTAPGQVITVSSVRDADAIAAKIDKMVVDVNDALSTIIANSAYNATTKTGGPLLSNGAVRQVRQNLAAAVSGDAVSSASGAGIALGADGKVTFDKAKFLEQWAKDPAGTAALFNDGPVAGLGKRLYDAADQAVSTDGGLLTASQDAVSATVTQLTDAIAAMQLRLDKRAITLRNQFNAMESALSDLRSRGAWLQSQLGTTTTQ
jgi:flagellar hook-associated protein 2